MRLGEEKPVEEVVVAVGVVAIEIKTSLEVVVEGVVCVSLFVRVEAAATAAVLGIVAVVDVRDVSVDTEVSEVELVWVGMLVIAIKEPREEDEEVVDVAPAGSSEGEGEVDNFAFFGGKGKVPNFGPSLGRSGILSTVCRRPSNSDPI